MTEQRPDGPAYGEAAIRAEIDALVRRVVRAVEDAEGNPHPQHVSARRTGLVQDMVRTALKLVGDGTDLGQAKVMERALREMRSAYRVFNRYKGVRKISIFGSARTPETHPDYHAAREFGRLMAAEGWMAITGAGNGVFRHAGLEAALGKSFNPEAVEVLVHRVRKRLQQRVAQAAASCADFCAAFCADLCSRQRTCSAQATKSIRHSSTCSAASPADRPRSL